MAILSNIILKNGLRINGAYLRVGTLTGNKQSIGFTLVPYQETNKDVPLEQGSYYEFVPDQKDNSPRWDKQAYRFLKTLEEFEDAIDVLEENQTP